MRNLREATRVFWTGWEWVPDYLASVKDHAWEVFWGAGIIGIPFTLLTLVWLPTWWHAFGYVSALVVLVAGYQLWRDYHIRFQPKLYVSRVIAYKWETPGIVYDKSPDPLSPSNSQGVSREGTAYYFEILGLGEASTIRDVRAQLVAIDPPVLNLAILPVFLRQRGDNVMKGVPPAQNFDLHAGDSKIIELVHALSGASVFTVEHIAWDAEKQIPRGRYRFNVKVSAQDTPVQSIWFDVFMDVNGGLQCDMTPAL